MLLFLCPKTQCKSHHMSVRVPLKPYDVQAYPMILGQVLLRVVGVGVTHG